MGMPSAGGNKPGSSGPAELKGVGNPSSGPANKQKPGCACEQHAAVTMQNENRAQLLRVAETVLQIRQSLLDNRNINVMS